MMGDQSQEADCSEFVEVDPTGRYGRYNEILGKGSSKTVYKAFDEYEGIEVAWNQVKLYDFLQSHEELERLYCEIHLLKTLKHNNIMKFYTSWVDASNRNINFVTEMFTSGTLRQYRQKHRRVNIRALKHWCRQILKGLLFLHSHDPPIIHRDLKCDNIFINGNQGEVKIGDLGLAAILRKSHAANCVGTPEFMAPEIYEEQYNELVDIYSFGMCILEMVTFEYPYSECTHPAQIYKKVTSGLKPESLYKVEDPEVRRFVEKCLATMSRRLPAKELLKDPFLQIDDFSLCTREDDNSELGSLARQLSLSPSNSNSHLFGGWSSNDHLCEVENEWEYDVIGSELHGIDLFSSSEDETIPDFDITIKGRRREDGQIFLRLRVADKEGQIRNIHFSFDVVADTALSVATEMVGELDITDYDVTSIAEMIDDQISSLVPDWNPGPSIEESVGFPTPRRCMNCELNSSSCTPLNDYHLVRTPSRNHLTSSHCSKLGCSASTHGRFEEVTYKVDESQPEGASELSSQANGPKVGSAAGKENDNRTESGRIDSFSRDGKKMFYHYRSRSISTENRTGTESLRTDSFSRDGRKSFSHNRSKSISTNRVNPSIGVSSIYDQSLATTGVGYQHPPPDLPEDYENEIRKELRWLREKYQMELRDHERQHFEETRRPSSPSLVNDEKETENGVLQSSVLSPRHSSSREFLNSIHFGMWLSSNLPYDKREPTILAAKARISTLGSAGIATSNRH